MGTRKALIQVCEYFDCERLKNVRCQQQCYSSRLACGKRKACAPGPPRKSGGRPLFLKNCDCEFKTCLNLSASPSGEAPRKSGGWQQGNWKLNNHPFFAQPGANLACLRVCCRWLIRVEQGIRFLAQMCCFMRSISCVVYRGDGADEQHSE